MTPSATTISNPPPTMSTILLVLHVLLCISLFWGCFIRAVRADSRVLVQVRVAFNLLAAAALSGLVVPLLGYQPTPWSVCMLAAIAYTQHITTHHWEVGPPDRFIRPEFRLRHRRRATDFEDSRHA